MRKLSVISVFVLLMVLMSTGTNVVMADKSGPPIIDPPPEAMEGGPTMGSLIDVVISDTSRDTKTSGIGLRSNPGLLGWSLLGWNVGWVYGNSKTEITDGDGYFYQLTVRSFLSAFGGCNRSSYDDDINIGLATGDKVHAYPDALWRIGCSRGAIHGEHAVLRITPEPMWSWFDITDITYTF